jgi:hypothetical protein
MAVSPNTRLCAHIKVNGVRCGSPSLRQEVFCYFHQRMIRGVRTPSKSRIHPTANFEDTQAIQASLMEVVNSLVRDQIDIASANLILRALSIAVRNSSKTHFDCWQSDMVREVPDYPAAPPTATPLGFAPIQQAAALATIKTPDQAESKPPQQAGSQAGPLSKPVHPAASEVDRTARPKPPRSVKPMSRPHAASRGRTG